MELPERTEPPDYTARTEGHYVKIYEKRKDQDDRLVTCQPCDNDIHADLSKVKWFHFQDGIESTIDAEAISELKGAISMTRELMALEKGQSNPYNKKARL